jgi:hypothetical protein
MLILKMSRNKFGKKSSYNRNFYGFSLSNASNPSPYVRKSDQTSKYAVEKELSAHDLPIPPSHLLPYEIAALTRNGYDYPRFSKEDMECAARYPQFNDKNKEDVLNMAEAMGIDTTGMAKIDACHAMNQMGLTTKKAVNSLTMKLGKVINQPKDWYEWQCERPTNVKSDFSCGRKSDKGVVAEGWEKQTFASMDECNTKCMKKDSTIKKFAPSFDDLLYKKQKESKEADILGLQKPVGPSIVSNGSKPPSGVVENAPFGKKCRRTKVKGKMMGRDLKGRFCKSKKAKKAKAKRGSARK